MSKLLQVNIRSFGFCDCTPICGVLRFFIIMAVVLFQTLELVFHEPVPIFCASFSGVLPAI